MLSKQKMANRYKDYDESMEELGELQVTVDELKEELLGRNTIIDDLTLELEDLSKVCTDMDEELENKKTEIDRLTRLMKAHDPMESRHACRIRLNELHASQECRDALQEYSQSANKDYFELRRLFFVDSSGNLPKSVEEVKKWFYKKMYVEDKFKIITPIELEHTTQSLYYYIRGETPDFGDADSFDIGDAD